MKKILTFIIIFTFLFTSIASAITTDIPSEKEEIIYGILDLDGSVKQLYVVNIFNSGTFTDYGDYSNVINMTTSDKIDVKDDKITLNANTDKFYYQGTLENKELPWDITIKYFLNDKEITGKNLAGKSGKLKISISIKQNTKIESTFYEDYALQITISLNDHICKNLNTENATIVQAGRNKQLIYTLLPGNEMNINVTADVEDFEMDPITINGIKLSLNLDLDTNELTKQFSELENAINSLDYGATELLTGLDDLSNGMKNYINGMKNFKDGLTSLQMGTNNLNTGASELKNGIFELTKQNELLISGALSIQQATFDSVNKQLQEMGLNLPILTPDNYKEVLSTIPGTDDIKEKLDNTIQFTQGIKEYTNGVLKLSEGASVLAEGTNEIYVSSSEIAFSANELYNAGEKLNTGIKELKNAFNSYKDGIEKLNNETSGMSDEISSKIDNLLGSISNNESKTISFVSPKNTNVSTVQFVLKTDSITALKTDKNIISEANNLNFWQRLRKLFGL